MGQSLNFPPFPPLIWDYNWVGKVKLPSWAGFQVRHGEGEGSRTTKESDGVAILSIASRVWNCRSNPTPEQAAAFRHLLDNESNIATAVARSLVEYCPGHAYDGDDEVLLEVHDIADLRPLIRLSTIHLLNAERDSVAYVGFEFGCAWDEEHGAGVMTHMGRVVATGQADCSFEEWIAKQDPGT